MTRDPCPDERDRASLRLKRARATMPVLAALGREFSERKPLAGHRLALCGHITAETAVQALTLSEIGAEIAWCASSLTTTDDAMKSLMEDHGIAVHGRRGMSAEEMALGIKAVLTHWKRGPTLCLDEGALLTRALHGAGYGGELPQLGAEKTPEGLAAISGLQLRYPMLKSDESFGKDIVDNPHGTAQSLLDTIIQVTGMMVAGKIVVIAGFGRVGSGLAEKVRGLGAHVVVTEVRPTRALIATLRGFTVLPMTEASEIGDIVCTVTGAPRIVDDTHLRRMKNGATLVNGGHLPQEIDLAALEALGESDESAGPGLTSYTFCDGKVLHLVGGGHIANLSAGRGNASEVMDVTFGSQVMGLLDSLDRKLAPGLHPLLQESETHVAGLLADAMGIEMATVQ